MILPTIERALFIGELSEAKEDILEFAQNLRSLGISIFSTDPLTTFLKKHQITVEDITTMPKNFLSRIQLKNTRDKSAEGEEIGLVVVSGLLQKANDIELFRVANGNPISVRTLVDQKFYRKVIEDLKEKKHVGVHIATQLMTLAHHYSQKYSLASSRS